MAFSIEVQNASLHLIEKVRQLQENVLPVVADLAVTELIRNDPPPPARGSAPGFVSDRQRKFVMAGKRNGTIQIPYVRGRGAGKSQKLNRSYLVLRGTIAESQVVSTASYAQYVVGNKQAPIHQGRWLTTDEIAKRMKDSGQIKTVVEQAMNQIFG
ncbi:hypothetical protein UFOVP107_10 [uncultured Caudovirales phage]|uniref:Uncharacterized protein n=1 Tax=uncultured Caudovirales phage TaxID=2100421 RepID=A0A6J7WKQ1_9CAUD|nr:hypothetical protein UFOVP107_10 [uncultured Caudovirales phage]CAB5218631.1 hypothetical protein UFOVP214_41 [uncultured Caudovirales phage]